ncbi:MAG: glycosyltransferase [Verrucomicrobia bacterium]|nr:glycosyltransferase [Verrucomicrobiota bacterium]
METPRRRLVLFTSLPKVGGHSTLTYGLCRLLKPDFARIEIWCKVMPEHGHSEPLADKLRELGCEVNMLSDLHGKLRAAQVFRFFVRNLLRPPDVFFALAMRHLSPLLAVLSLARKRIYYQITHDLKPGTVRMLKTYARFFSKIVFICPATFEDFTGTATAGQISENSPPDDQAPGGMGVPPVQALVGPRRPVSKQAGRLFPLFGTTSKVAPIAAQLEKYSWIPQSSEIPVTAKDQLPAERCTAAAEGSPLRFGIIGRLTEEKGAEVMREFADSADADCELHVAGSGRMEPAFRELAGRDARPGKPVVHFHGAFDPAGREDFLRKFFCGIDHLVVPSQDEWETLSMAALESLQHGVPCVICRTGGLKSFAHPDLGPAPDSVIRLVDAADLPAMLDDLSRQPRPSWESTGQACLEHYDRHFSDAAILKRWQDLLVR